MFDTTALLFNFINVQWDLSSKLFYFMRNLSFTNLVRVWVAERQDSEAFSISYIKTLILGE